MAEKHKRIGISGGTFDPVHHGHLIAAETIREEFQLDEIIFIPVGLTPHKNISRVTDAEHRYNMTRLAVETNPYFRVSRMEIDRQGYTYTVDTLSQLKQEYGWDVQLFFIVGADVIRDLLTWRQYEKVFQMCEFIATLRPGFEEKDFIHEIDNLKNRYGARIHIAKMPLIDISSTTIRSKVGNNKSIKYLVPEKVEQYIMEHGLYKDFA